MNYYTEGFIVGVGQSSNEKKLRIKFQPTPPFLFEENGKVFCMIKDAKDTSDVSARLLACDEKKSIELPALMLDATTALALKMHVKIKVGGETDDKDKFTDWETI